MDLYHHHGSRLFYMVSYCHLCNDGMKAPLGRWGECSEKYLFVVSASLGEPNTCESEKRKKRPGGTETWVQFLLVWAPDKSVMELCRVYCAVF